MNISNNSWKSDTLGSVCIINPSKKEISGLKDDLLVSFIPMSSVSENGKIISLNRKRLGEVKKGYTYFKEGDILLAKITPCFENGKRAIAKGLFNSIGFGTTEFHVLRPLEKVTSEWIFYTLSREDFRAIAKRSMTGAVGQQRVPKQALEQFKIPVPTIKEQNKIIQEIEKQLSRVEASVDNLKSVKSKLQTYRKAVLKKSFEGKETELGKAFEIIMGQSPPSEYYNRKGRGLPFFQGKKEFGLKFPKVEVWTEKYNKEANKGDLLVSVRAPIGPCNITQEKCAIGRGIAAIKANNEIESLLLYYLIKYNEQGLDSRGTGTTFKAISKSTLNSFIIKIPEKRNWEKIVLFIESKFSIIDKVEAAVDVVS